MGGWATGEGTAASDSDASGDSVDGLDVGTGVFWCCVEAKLKNRGGGKLWSLLKYSRNCDTRPRLKTLHTPREAGQLDRFISNIAHALAARGHHDKAALLTDTILLGSSGGLPSKSERPMDPKSAQDGGAGHQSQLVPYNSITCTIFADASVV